MFRKNKRFQFWLSIS